MKSIKTFTICLMALSLCPLARGQVSLSIGDFKSFEQDHNSRISRPFVGTIELSELISPGIATQVDFTLEVVGYPGIETNVLHQSEWVIKLAFDEGKAEITGKREFRWPGLHKVGDKFRGSFLVRPLESGECQISIYKYTGRMPHRSIQRRSGIGFEWCLDGEGKLEYLRASHFASGQCGGVSTAFFNEDSVIIYQNERRSASHGLWYKVSIIPTPKIGDTSEIHYYLTASRKLEGPWSLGIESSLFEILGQPKPLPITIDSGQSLDIEFSVIPKPIRYNSGLSLYLTKLREVDTEVTLLSIGLPFLFNEDKTLRYANDQSLGHVPEYLYPKSFPFSTEKDHTKITITPPSSDKSK